jgi:hypothetical protein
MMHDAIAQPQRVTAARAPISTPAKLLALAGSERRAVALTAAVAVADATGDGSHVYSGRDQLGDEEVAQVVEPASDAEAAG